MQLKERITNVLRDRLEQFLEEHHSEELLRETAAAVVKEVQAFIREADVEG